MASSGLPPLDGDVSRGDKITIAVSILFGASLVTTCVRMYVRKYIVRQIGWDDFTICWAMILDIPAFALEIVSVNKGIGHHEYDLDFAQTTQALKYSQLSRLFFVITTYLTKVSICLFLMRIPEDGRLRKFLYGVMGVFTLVNVAWLVVFLSQCDPISGLWDARARDGCWDRNIEVVVDYVQGGLAIATDLILSLAPVKLLWGVQMPLRRKLLICGLMSAGIFATACTCVRIALTAVNLNIVDQTWAIVPETIWSILELNIAFIAANLPPMYPIFKHLRQKLAATFAWATGRSNARNSNSRIVSYPPDFPPAFTQRGRAEHYSPNSPHFLSNSTHFFQLRELSLDKIISKEIQEVPVTPTTIGDGDEEGERGGERADDGGRDRGDRDVKRGGGREEREGEDGETDYGTNRTISTESMV